jgi:O-antigen ligase
MNNNNYILNHHQTDAQGITTESQGITHKLALFSLLGFIFLMPWADGVYDGLPRILGVLSFGLSGFLLVTRGTHTNYSFYHLFVALLWVWVIVSLAWTPDEVLGGELAVTGFQLMLLPFVFTFVIDNRKNLLLAYQSYIVGAVVAFGFIFNNYLHNITEFYGRYTIANIDTDLMSYILALAIPMAAYLAKAYQNKFMVLFNIVAIPVIMYAIFLTGTRTGFIVGMLGIFYWLFTQRKASLKIKLIMFILFIASIGVVLTFAPKASVDRVLSAGSSIKSGDLNYRTVIWKTSIQEWKNSPIIGTGVGGLYSLLSRQHVNYAWAHNTFIHLLTENGIIGLTLYVLMIFSILYFILRAPFEEKIFLLSLLLVMLVSQIALHTHIQKATWFSYSMLFIHAFSTTKRRL